MHTFVFSQLQSLMPLFWGEDHDLHNDPLKRQAFKSLKSRIATLSRRNRVTRIVKSGDPIWVWSIEFAPNDVLYCDRRNLYAVSAEGYITPRSWFTISADEINFILLYL